jgi:hypothetical protein
VPGSGNVESESSRDAVKTFHDLDAELHALSIATDGVKSILGPTVRNWVIYETNGDRTWVYRTPRERSREVAVQPQDIPAEGYGPSLRL